MRGQHIYSDQYIEHYAKRYLTYGFRSQGITLLQYLATPEACERLATRYVLTGRVLEPLLLPQEIAREAAALERRRRVEADVQAVPRRAGWPFEKLRHHSRKSIGWSQRRFA